MLHLAVLVVWCCVGVEVVVFVRQTTRSVSPLPQLLVQRVVSIGHSEIDGTSLERFTWYINSQHARNHLLILLTPWCAAEPTGNFDDFTVFLRLCHGVKLMIAYLWFGKEWRGAQWREDLYPAAPPGGEPERTKLRHHVPTHRAISLSRVTASPDTWLILEAENAPLVFKELLPCQDSLRKE